METHSKTEQRPSARLGCMLVLCGVMFWGSNAVAASSLFGNLTDPQGSLVTGATVRISQPGGASARQALSDNQGQFFFSNLDAGEYRLTAEFPGFAPAERDISLTDGNCTTNVQFSKLASQSEFVTVTASASPTDILSPDPGQQVFLREDLVDANPGHAGAPVSIPGYPIETASSGIKAPQYFAPGVAGDHGEPIAQFIAVGSYLVPNNLSANAHGNGYSDPNIFIPEVVESVQIDGGAFNVLEGNHAVNLAATYGLRSTLNPFITVTGDYRDIDFAGGFSPTAESLIAFEGSYGNGFLDRLEHRQQYKINGQQIFQTDNHKITLLGIAYYGFSHIAGLVPIAPSAYDTNFPNIGDTIDPRQKDQSHTVLLALNDVWQLSHDQQLRLSTFFRTYNLSLFSNFGQGLIRQSEFRTVVGGSANYTNRISDYLSILCGFDYQREAPRRDDLDHYGFFDPALPNYYGPFTAIDGNNLTLSSFAPYAAAEGRVTHLFHYYLGWRRDEIDFYNEDRLAPQNSFQKWVGVNSPKATVSFLPKDTWYVPLVSLSFGQAFFTEDPRIGLGNTLGSPVANSRSYQLIASKTLHKTDFRLTLGHVTNSAELAKIDPDTGLQFNQGPSRLRFMTLAVRRSLSFALIQASVSKADARDLDLGQPTPEAPRTIFDFSAALRKLPFRLQAKGELEYVGKKPLGTGCNPLNLNAECTGTSVREFRGAVVRPIWNDRLDAGVNFLIANGYTGQTTENVYPSNIQEVVGVRTSSYASITFTYRFGSGH